MIVRNNLPVSSIEQTLAVGSHLISRTDLKGNITYANQSLVRLTGFSEDELIGNNQNILRHPDMPPAVFKWMWETLQDGRPWRGLLKNRCKNGDHYWIDAFIAPAFTGDTVSGYLAVSDAPSREAIAAAEIRYAKLRG